MHRTNYDERAAKYFQKNRALRSEITVASSTLDKRLDELTNAYAVIDEIVSHLGEHGPEHVLHYVSDLLDEYGL